MRKVERSPSGPHILTSSQARTAIEAIAAHYALADEQRLTRRVPLDRAVLYSIEIVQALHSLFHGKCAYCERVLSGTTGTVDHFRPLQGARDKATRSSNPFSADYYGWFAYEWRNFYLTCRECSSRKANFFPVDSDRRATPLCTWEEAIQIEVGTLLDPCEDHPLNHLAFTANGAVKPLTRRGEVTTNVLELNRPPLVHARAQQIAKCIDAIDHSEPDITALQKTLDGMIDDEAPHAGAVRSVLTRLGTRLAADQGRSRPSARNLTEGLAQLLVPIGPDDLRAALYSTTDIQSDPLQPVALQGGVPHGPEVIVQPLYHSPIASVEIRNFRGIEKLTLDLTSHTPTQQGPGCAMLLGENATGKSSVLQAIALCLMGSKLRGQMGITVDRLLSREPRGWKLTGLRHCFVGVTFADGSIAELKIDAVTRKIEGTAEPVATLMAFGARRFFEDQRKRRRAADSARTLFDPLWTLADPTTWLQGLTEANFYSVARAMREIFALQSDDDLVLDERRNIFVRAHSRDTPIQQMSEGYRSVFAMTVSLMRLLLARWHNFEEAQGIVLIDEIETHLHPRWKIRVVSALRRAFPRLQFIATTHDPLCLRGMLNGEAHVLFRDADRQIQELQGLPDITALRTDQLLTSDFFSVSSTSDPEFESKLDTLASLSADSQSGRQEQRLSELAAEIENSMVIGDTPLRQIISAATREFTRRYEETPLDERLEMRQEGIKAVLEALIRARDA